MDSEVLKFLVSKDLFVEVEYEMFGRGIEHRSLPSGKGEGGIGQLVKEIMPGTNNFLISLSPFRG
jgi:hypothetical protein